MFNEKLLIEVLGWQSESSKEKEQIIPTLYKYLDSIKSKQSLIIEEDTHGNIYVTKGKADLYPCIVSHLDQVHKYSESKTIIKHGDYLLAFNGPNQIGTGGDDLVGVFICLQLLNTVKEIKVVFFREEEIGCVGSNNCDLEFFKNCKFIGQADRKESSDFINYSNGVKLFDTEFSEFIKPILDLYGYKECGGVSTDVGCLSKRNVNIACFNISCGYYFPHTSKEYVNILNVETCYNVILDIINGADKQFKYVRPALPEYKDHHSKSKSQLYTLLYNEFKNDPKFIKSQSMNYAYSLAIQFVDDLVTKIDSMIDLYYQDYPYVTDMLIEFLQMFDDDRKYGVKHQTHLIQKPTSDFPKLQQGSLFPCLHKNTLYDATMDKLYCMDCFQYIEDSEAFYDSDTLHSRVGNSYYTD